MQISKDKSQKLFEKIIIKYQCLDLDFKKIKKPNKQDNENNGGNVVTPFIQIMSGSLLSD